MPDSYTSSLVHFDDGNGATTITDETGKSWTVRGNTVMTSSSPKFGASCVQFDGDQDDAYTAADAEFDFGAGDFSVEAWVKRNGDTGLSEVIVSVENSWILGINAADKLIWVSYSPGYTGTNLTSSSSITADSTWHHVAVDRAGNDWKMYIDGSVEDSETRSGVDFNDVGNPLGIGAIQSAPTNNEYIGFMDELRVSKGIARWQGAFTPPGAPYGFVPKVMMII